ncbi:Osiris 8-like protein, partial [Operophtera brumata]
MVPHYLLILTLAITVSARTAGTSHNKVDSRSSEESTFGELKLAYETYKECSGDDITHCLKQKLAKTLTRLARSDELNVLNGVTIKKDKDAKIEDVEAAVPRGMDESSLDNLIMDKIIGFMQSHTFQVRRKKMAPLLAIPILIMGMLVPLAFGALALLAGKALIVSKLALVLAGIIGLKKLLSSNHGGGHESHEVVVSAGHGGSGWS